MSQFELEFYGERITLGVVALGVEISAGWVQSHQQLPRHRDSDERFVAVLEIPPVVSAEMAVKVAIAAELEGRK